MENRQILRPTVVFGADPIQHQGELVGKVIAYVYYSLLTTHNRRLRGTRLRPDWRSPAPRIR